MNPRLRTGITSLLLLATVAVSAAPLQSDRLAMGLPASGEVQGELVELQAGESGFLAIFRPRQRGPARGGVVLLHDRETGANSLEVMRPLRLGLAASGWDTLSLQLSADGRSLPDDAAIRARLQAGLDWLKSRKSPRLAVVALGESGIATLDLAADGPPRELLGVVLVSAGQTASRGDGPRGDVRLPVLDLYAEFDRPGVLDAARSRRNGFSTADNTDFTQRTVAGAQAGYFRLEEELLSRVRSWLAKQAGAQAAAVN